MDILLLKTVTEKLQQTLDRLHPFDTSLHLSHTLSEKCMVFVGDKNRTSPSICGQKLNLLSWSFLFLSIFL